MKASRAAARQTQAAEATATDVQALHAKLDQFLSAAAAIEPAELIAAPDYAVDLARIESKLAQLIADFAAFNTPAPAPKQAK